jgi:hypothetical protein
LRGYAAQLKHAAPSQMFTKRSARFARSQGPRAFGPTSGLQIEARAGTACREERSAGSACSPLVIGPLPLVIPAQAGIQGFRFQQRAMRACFGAAPSEHSGCAVPAGAACRAGPIDRIGTVASRSAPAMIPGTHMK